MDIEHVETKENEQTHCEVTSKTHYFAFQLTYLRKVDVRVNKKIVQIRINIRCGSLK